MKKIELNKDENSQQDMELMLVIKLMYCIKEISKLQETKCIPDEGLTMFVSEVGLSNIKWDLTISLTKKG